MMYVRNEGWLIFSSIVCWVNVINRRYHRMCDEFCSDGYITNFVHFLRLYVYLCGAMGDVYWLSSKDTCLRWV